MKRSFLGLLMLLSLAGCTLSQLDIQTKYLSEDSLASYHVGTPDPRLADPPRGQRLMIQWSLSSKEIENRAVELYLRIRFRNRQEREIHYSLYEKQGTYCYDLTDQAYLDSAGIVTYKAEIWADECLLASWTHPLWVELIRLNQNKP